MTQYLPLRVVVTICAVTLAILHMLLPSLEIDSVTVVLLIVSALPWLQPLVKSIELLGIKLELQELKTKIENAQGAAQSAEKIADLAVGRQRFSGAADLAQTTDGYAALSRLGEEYNRIRETRPSGSDRTQAMTDVVGRMIEIAEKTQHGFDVESALMSDNRGQRLGAYSFLYARPDQKMVAPLVESVTQQEDKPFGQYWGIQALSRVLAAGDGRLMDEPLRQRLASFASRLPRGSDRHYELMKILGNMDNAADNS